MTTLPPPEAVTLRIRDGIVIGYTLDGRVVWSYALPLYRGWW